MKTEFWKYPVKLRSMDFGLFAIQHHLVERAFETKETLEFYYNAGSLRPGVNISEVIDEMKKLDGHLMKHQQLTRHANEDWLFTWWDSGVEIEYYTKNRGITVTIRSLNLDLVLTLRKYFEGVVTRTTTKGRVYVVAAGRNGPQLQEMGVAGEEFIPSNYRPETSKEYKHVVEDLNKANPCGRIILLDGPPGTGKTHMVRALLNEVPKATFVLVPSNFISSLGSPEFLAVLMREQKKDAPLILILEDADEALVNRKEGNSSAISSLLNFSDGIFGTLLDMRLICTTNVEIDNLDPAVVRDGRLCTRVEIGLLDTDMANVVYERLTGKKGELKDKFYKLGTVYKIAKGNGNLVEKSHGSKKKSMGFAMGAQAVEGASIVDEVIAQIGDEQTDTYERVGDKDVKVENDDIDDRGTPITAVVKGELVEVGFITPSGNVVLDSYDGDSMVTFESDDEPTSDDELIDEDPDEEAQLLPDFIKDSDDGHDDLEDVEQTPRDTSDDDD